MIQYVALSVLAGLFIPLQALLNARLASYLTGPISAAFTNFAVGLIGLSLYVIVLRLPAPSAAQIAITPWWAWVGGLLGAYFVAAAAITVPKLGAAGMVSIIIAAQLIAAIVLDHYGVLHEAQPVSATRLAGAVLLLIGAYLILRPQG